MGEDRDRGHEGTTDLTALERQRADSEKATAALQEMVDALAGLPALEQFVPAALKIVARAFETKDCAYYEHRAGDPIRLRYWFFEGEVFGPEEIRAFADEHGIAELKAMEAGFVVPDAYLGVPFRKRTKASVRNHATNAPRETCLETRKRLDWSMMLNVPLVIAGEADGALVIHRGAGSIYLPEEVELAERLAQSLAFAMAVDRITFSTTQATQAKEREESTQAQIVEMAKSDDALQQMTDALAAMPDLENFIPAALRIAAEAFDAKNCQYYEHRRDELIRLRYWLYKNRVLGPAELAELGDEFEFMRLNAEGFMVPDSYLGMPFRQRTKATVVNHAEKPVRTPREEFAIANGWGLELNIPLVVAGEADGALVICREAGPNFTHREVSLAERLGQQLALAMEVDRLSAAANQAAVAQERERAARERTAELSRHAEVLKQTVDSLVSEEDFLGFIGKLLGIASVQLQAPITEYWTDDGEVRATLVLTYRNGIIYQGSDDSDDVRTKGIEIAPKVVRVTRYKDRKTHQVIDMLGDADFRKHVENFGMPVARWCAERGVQQLIIVPLLRNEDAFGSLCLYLPVDRLLEQSQLDLAFSIGQQVSLAVRMTELAEQSKQSALLQEREAAANDRAAELSKANVVLRSTLEQLSDERDLQTFPRAILRMAMEQLRARDGVIFVLDKETATLNAREYLGSENSPLASTIEFSQPFPIDSAPIWANALAARGPVVYDIDRDGDVMLPGAAEWHRKRGNNSVVVVPMFINTEPYGYFGMGLEQYAEAVSKVELELMQALTQQASLAIQLTRLAEESKQSALAQEREKAAEERAAEFANANEVLRSTLDQLSGEEDLHSFPRTILNEAMKQTGARDGLILIYDEQTDTLNRSEYINALGLPPSEEFLSPFSAGKTPAWKELMDRRCPIVFDVEDDRAMLLPGLADWHRQRGNRSIIASAMFIDSQPYGYFGITLGERAAEVSKVKTGLIHALTQQATLAIQLTTLAESSQQAAIMVERQQIVVQERANLAREIHDKLAQGYAAILMQQHTMRRSLQHGRVQKSLATPLLEQLDIIERLSRDNLAEARRTMDELRVDPFGPGDLAHSLNQCINQLTEEDDFSVALKMEEDLPSLRRYVATELCRIVREAVTNARKHARTQSADVFVTRTLAGVNILVRDTGVGFDMQSVGGSFGIASMQERAARAGAEIEITSAPGRGTTVEIKLNQ